MTSKEIVAALFDYCEGLEQEIENTPVMSSEKILKWLSEIMEMPAEQQADTSADFIYALVKGLEVGAVEIQDVM